jgi:hypothetical protein
LNGYALDPLPLALLAPSLPESGGALVAPQPAAGDSSVSASLPEEERESDDATAQAVPADAAEVEPAPGSAPDSPEVERQAVAGGAGQAEV